MSSETIRLTLTQIRSGRAMAAELGIRSEDGNTISWRALVRALLDGQLAVRRLEDTGVEAWRRCGAHGQTMKPKTLKP